MVAYMDFHASAALSNRTMRLYLDDTILRALKGFFGM